MCETFKDCCKECNQNPASSSCSKMELYRRNFKEDNCIATELTPQGKDRYCRDSRGKCGEILEAVNNGHNPSKMNQLPFEIQNGLNRLIQDGLIKKVDFGLGIRAVLPNGRFTKERQYSQNENIIVKHNLRYVARVIVFAQTLELSEKFTQNYTQKQKVQYGFNKNKITIKQVSPNITNHIKGSKAEIKIGSLIDNKLPVEITSYRIHRKGNLTTVQDTIHLSNTRNPSSEIIIQGIEFIE